MAAGRDYNRNKQTQVVAGLLVRALAKLRRHHDSMTLLQAMSLLYIAQNPGTTAHDLFKALGTSDAVASRTLSLLSNLGESPGTHLGLVEMTPNPEDRREKFLTLTRDGHKLIADVTADFRRGP